MAALTTAAAPAIYMAWTEENMKNNMAFLFQKTSFPPVGKKGFTLMEILVSVMILTILITMSVPMYERTVEKSRVAEVSAMLKRISESKLRTMDSMNITTFTNGSFGLNMLDVDVPASDDFSYRLYPSSFPNAVCAMRLRGDNAGTQFLYLGETAPDYCNCNGPLRFGSVCAAYCSSGRKLFCQGNCDVYGLDSYSDMGSCSN